MDSSHIIDILRDKRANEDFAIAFLYFDYRDQTSQSPENMVASLVRQVAENKPSIPSPVMGLYSKFGSQSKNPQLEDLERTLMMTCLDFEQTFIIIDALDECDESNHRRVFLGVLERMSKRRDIRLLLTSRPHPQDIRNALKSGLQICIEANDMDLRAYLSDQLDSSGATDFIDNAFKAEIIERITNGAQKM